MKFTSFQSLFLVWATPVLLLFFIHGMRKRKRILKRYATARGLESICPEADSSRRWAKNILMLACVLFLSIAMAGPQYGFKWEEIEQKGVDIILAVDCSKSMLARDIKPTRLDRAKREILDLISILKGDRVGLVAFAGTAFLQCPLTLDYDGFHIFLDVLSPDFLPVGGTDLAGAIRTAISAFDKKSNTEKAIILVTDGESTRGDPMMAAEEALRSQVKLFCIGVGSTGGAPAPDDKGGFRKDDSGSIVLTKLEEGALKQAALATGGAYVRSVAGDMDLGIIYEQEIRGKMKAETLSAGKRKIWQNRYQWALFLAIAAFSLEIMIFSVKSAKQVLALTAFVLCSSLLTPAGIHAEGVQEKMQKGLEAYNRENYEKAMEYFIEAQLEEPERAEIAYNLGAAYYRLGDYEAAERNFAQALNAQSQELKAKSLYNLGNAYFRQQNFERAIESYEAALEIVPDDKEAAENLAFAKEIIKRQKNRQSNSDQDSGRKTEEQNQQEQSGTDQGEKQQNDSQQHSSSRNDRGDSAAGQENRQYSSETGEEDSNGQREFGHDREKNQKRKTAQAQKIPESGEEGESEKTDAVKKRLSETMLNRLEDKPGRAMIPAYGETRVEKDW